MTQSVNIMPCPFCGSEPFIEDGENERPWVVQCINKDCPAQPFMDHADTKRQALKAWNHRAIPPASTSTAIAAECVMVPVKPTQAMLEAAYAVDEDIACGANYYAAMIAAAPKAASTTNSGAAS